MKHFVLGKYPDKDIVRFEKNDYRYLVRVRRLAVGEFFPAILPDGTKTFIQVVSVERGVLTGKTTGSSDLSISKINNQSPKINLPPIFLFQAMPKGEKMDLIVRQAAEGGITEIIPFVSEFSFAKTKTGKQKFSRWERIIKEARQQSGSEIATSIHQPLIMDEVFEYWGKLRLSGTLGLIFHHQPLEQTSLHSYLDSNPCVIVLVIGPEGGFSEIEITRFLEAGFKPITIGNTIFRTETAALYCAAAVRVLLLERNSWELKKEETV